jgi:GNAT superfamily N-acetyltransferase
VLVEDISGRIEDPEVRSLLSLSWSSMSLSPTEIGRRAEGRLSLGVLRDDRVVGLVVIRLGGSASAIIEALSVEAGFRHHGIGRALLEAAAMKVDAGELIAETDADAVDFYRACGFEVESVGERYPNVERFRCVRNVLHARWLTDRDPAAPGLAAEEPLAGGNLLGAVRVGATVRKPAGPWTLAVDGLLRHLEASGWTGAPRSLGVDEQRRHVLTFVEGETVGDGAVKPWPAWCWAEDTIDEVAAWLRTYHELVKSFRPKGAVWRYERRLKPGWVICHNDVAPYNAVWRDGLVALIDWDIASPGDPMSDVAQAAWQFAPLHHPSLTEALGAHPGTAPRRARRLLDAYGVTQPAAFIDLIPDRIRGSIDGIQTLAQTDAAFAKLAADHVPDLRQTLRYVERIRPLLGAAFR